MTTANAADRRAAIRFIVCFGLVSLFADMTYEGARSIVGPLLGELGASAAVVGLVAGFGEMIAASLRFFTGRLADKTHAYWTFAITGYAVNLVVVPALAFAGTWQAAALLIIAERTGKALRGPARDVLISEATEVVGHGFGFSIHAAMDQTGAVLGPLIIAAMVARDNKFGPAFLVLAIPAVLALLSILLARAARPQYTAPKLVRPHTEIPRVFWHYVAAAGLLACGFLDFPLIAYHFQKTAMFSREMIPLLYALAMGMVGASALVYGKLFDRFGIRVLSVGILLSLFALPFAFFGGQVGGILGVVCWGAGFGVQDATLRSGIAQVVSMNKRGTAFGSFNAVYGIAWFAGSALMGLLYDHSVMAVVIFGVAAQAIAAAVFFALRRPLEAARQ